MPPRLPKDAPAEVLDLLTAEERARLERLDLFESALRSPLDLAEALNPATVRYPHVEFINDHLVAVFNYRLYATGPEPEGKEAAWFYEDRDGLVIPLADPALVPAGAVDYYGVHPDDLSLAGLPIPGARRVILRLAIACPPRHGKSFLVSQYLPLWLWLRWPTSDTVIAAYSDEMATMEWGAHLRDKLVSDSAEKSGALLGLMLPNGARSSTKELRPAQAQYGIFGTKDGVQPAPATFGRALFCGIGGALTGKGWTNGIIDDPFKNADEANSEAVRNQKANWYTTTWSTRRTKLNGQRVPVEIMMYTRWHLDDLTGRFVLDPEGEVLPDWYLLRLPALAEDDDPLGREVGEALCPQLVTRAQLLKLQKDDPIWFAALYQGSPMAQEGALFKQYRFHFPVIRDGDTHYTLTGWDNEPIGSIPAADCVRFATVDTTGTRRTSSDWAVCSLWDYHMPTQTLVLVDRHRERMDSNTHLVWLKQILAGYEIAYVGVEDRTYGTTLLQEIALDGTFVGRPMAATADKVTRAVPYAEWNRIGRIYLPRGAEWISTWLQEHNQFPRAKFDDQVDTGSMAVESVRHMIPTERKDPAPSIPWHEARLHKKPARKIISGRLGW